MATDYLNTVDEMQAEVLASSQPDRKPYEVVADSGLFKNGKQIKKGDTVQLDEKTAANFIASGDIKEL